VQRFPTRSASPDPTIQKLLQQVTQLEQKMTMLQKLVQVDSAGQNLTLKVPANISIEAGTALDIKGGAMMKLQAAKIDVN
jgi:invasion protein IalB